MLCGLLLEGCEERWCEAGRPTSGDAFYAYQTMRAALGDEAERFVLSPAVLNLVGDLSGDEAHIERQHHLVRAPYPVTVPEIAAVAPMPILGGHSWALMWPRSLLQSSAPVSPSNAK